MANPFGELIQMINNIPITKDYYIGIVSSKLPNLKIKFEGTEIDKEDFLISSNLVINNNAKITCSNGTISHNLKDELNIGDKVLILNVNGICIILCKVVSI